MNATLTLDQASDASFTNLDEVSGKVVLRCSKSTTISSILVKLEGESRTRLMSTTAAVNERPKPQLEYHKVLYKVAMVFPDAQILEGREQTTSKGNYTLQAGTHEWPWTFKIPFNNACANERGQMPTISIAGGLEIAKAPTRHVKKTLPPTLSGFPGQAEVRYYVKVTVDRQSFFKENPRAFLPFNFFPIEPPRPPSTGDEAFARQKYTFAASDNVAKGKSKLKELFGAQSKDSPSAADAHFSVDARLPSPSILACNGIVPLRLIVKKLSDYDGILYLQSLQVSLVGSTRIRAHNVFRNESTSWIITSTSNMNVPLGRIGDAVNTETIIDDRMWRGHPLPNTVAPTFETCNIIRTYHLDIRIQLSHGALHGGAKPQSVVLPLRLDVDVFSGIAPPPQLLQAMADTKANAKHPLRTNTSATVEQLRTQSHRQTTHSEPATPVDEAGPSQAQFAPPQRGPDEPRYEDAPPSYEDAIATDMPSMDAPRPEYAPPPPNEDDGFLGDEKKDRRSMREV